METNVANKKLRTIDDVDKFYEYLKEISNASSEWKEYFESKRKSINEDDFTNVKTTNEYIAWQCGVSVDTVRKNWVKKFPDKRLNAIFLALTLKMDVEEINKMLNRFGKQPSLYAKNISDAICIYLAETRCYELNEPIYEQYNKLKDSILCMYNKKSFGDLIKSIVKTNPKIHTQTLNKALSTIKHEKAFYKYISSNLSEFKNANDRLYRHIESYMERNAFTLKTVSTYEGFKPAFNTKYSHIKSLCECPSRNDLIALGIALRMTIEELNNMLNIAHMDPLYSKDRIEAAIIFVIFDIKRSFPDIFNDDSTEEGLGLSDAHIMEYLNYRKARSNEYIDVKDPEMMSYLKQAIYNIDVELWNDTKKFLDIIV